MVDIDAAIGFVVARGDTVDRARLSWLRAGMAPGEDVLGHVEMGQNPGGGWPARWAGDVSSVDATCFRLAELDDLDGLRRPAARRALDWLANRQGTDGFWEEDSALADVAPFWARPGDPDARFYVTANASFWLAVGAFDGAAADGVAVDRPDADDHEAAPSLYQIPLSRASKALRESISADGVWPGYLIAGWLAGAVLHQTGWFYEAARILVNLAERVPTMSAADTAWMGAALRRIGISPDDPLLQAARSRLAETQRSDGSWPSDEEEEASAFDVHTTLTAIRAAR
jgi:hypothetical protein